MYRLGLEPRPSVWEANTLEKSHLDSLCAGYSEPLLMMSLLHPDLYMAPPVQVHSTRTIVSVEGMPEGDSKSASLNRTYCYPNSTDGHE
jgi:hypothetical protein